MRRVAPLLLCAVLAAGCSGGEDPEEPVRPSPTATHSTLAGPEVAVCKKLPADVLSLVLGVRVDEAKPAAAGGRLLGECDYTRSDDGGYQHIFIGARANADYNTYVSRYSDVQVTVGDGKYKGAYGLDAGLLIKVPGQRYFLQIAVQGADGDMLLTPAQRVAEFYVGSS